MTYWTSWPKREGRKAEGEARGRSEAAAYAQWYCDTMRPKVKAELERRSLPATRPGNKRVYGPGQAQWQGNQA